MEILKVAVGLFLVMPVVFYFFGDFDLDDLPEYLAVSLGVVIVLILVYQYILNKVRSDLKERTKLTGTTVLERKSLVLTRTGQRHHYFNFSLDGEREVHVDKADYHRFSEGDEIYVEMTKHSRLVLSMKRVEERRLTVRKRWP